MVVNQLDRPLGDQNYTGKQFLDKKLAEWKAEQVVGNQKIQRKRRAGQGQKVCIQISARMRKFDRQDI